MANTEHPINGMMETTLEKIRQMVDSNTIVGNPISTPDGSTILPISKVSFAFTSAGTDHVSSKVPKDLFGGGSAAGVSITPVGFLVLSEGNVRFIQMADKDNNFERVLNMVPEVMDRIGGFVSGKKSKTEAQADAVAQEDAAVRQAVQDATAATASADVQE